MRKDFIWMVVSSMLFIFSMISGGAAAILVQGGLYDFIYAVHKIISVLAFIIFIVTIVIVYKR